MNTQKNTIVAHAAVSPTTDESDALRLIQAATTLVALPVVASAEAREMALTHLRRVARMMLIETPLMSAILAHLESQ